ncbi:MAG: alpha/beta fold hydrolase [Desulfomonilaceae bacterium]|nr:alpha/beta fold hydrolase [Desulfomonilaceae bacterium]
MPEVCVRGRRLAYAVQPLDFDKSSPAVVFIHGSGGSREDWRGQLDGLASTATVIALELPGHGESDPPAETSVPAYAEWVTDFVEALSLQRVVVVGCSLGSAVAQHMALSPRPWLKAIGLVGAGARLKVMPALLEGLRTSPESSITMIGSLCISPAAPDPLRQEVLERLSAASGELIHHDFSACNGFDVMSRVHEIDLPTCIIVGADDKLTPVKYSEFLRDAISGSRLHVIPEAGHLVMVEKPHDFNAYLKRFLQDNGLAAT